MMKMAVLYLALHCNKIHLEITRVRGLLRICLASGMGTLIEITGLLFSSSYNVFVVVVHLFEVPFMVWWVLGKGKREMIRVVVSGYFFTMLINGVLEALWNQFGEQGSYMFYLLFSCGVVIVGVRIWKNYTKMQKGIFRVEVLFQDKQIQSNAFYDSGNRLIDPYTGKGVHIVSEQLINKAGIVSKINVLGETEKQEISPVYIPYQALGNEAGLLEVYYIDEIVIEGEKGRKHILNCPVGVTKDDLFEGKNYEMILNEEVF